jgi:hypothetical protein
LKRIKNYSNVKSKKIPLSLFAYENRYDGGQVVTIWKDDEIPKNTNQKENINFTFYGGNFSAPCYVDLRTGQIFEIPLKYWQKNGTVYRFNSIPVYDSPILISDKNIIPIKE